MRSKAGIIIGFVTGFVGFLFLFKIIILDHTSPADELAPGIVMLTGILAGILFAFVGKRVQHYLEKNSKKAA